MVESLFGLNLQNFLPSLFSNQVVLTDNDFIEVIYDDFSDFL